MLAGETLADRVDDGRWDFVNDIPGLPFLPISIHYRKLAKQYLGTRIIFPSRALP